MRKADSTTAESFSITIVFSERMMWLYVAIAVVSLIGLADAMYLTIGHLTGAGVRCGSSFGCSEVLTSSYAVVGGVPLAGIGAAAYFAVFSLSVLAAFGYGAAQRPLSIVIWLMAGFSLWLLFVQAFVLRAFCLYCLLSASVTFTLAGLMLLRTYLKNSEDRI